jgi:biopolymer transport protein ExbD
MIIAPEERKAQGPLIAFIDLLFLLVAFFVLLLFFIQSRQSISQEALERVQQNLARITGEEIDVPEALTRLETMVERYLEEEQAQMERERQLAEQRRRRAQRTTFRLEYLIDAQGRIVYQERSYSVRGFLDAVVTPLRGKHWVAFRALADAATPFGTVVESRRIVLKDSNEFDTYWDNVTRKEEAAGTPPR